MISSVFTRKEVAEEDILQREHRNCPGKSDNTISDMDIAPQKCEFFFPQPFDHSGINQPSSSSGFTNCSYLQLVGQLQKENQLN